MVVPLAKCTCVAVPNVHCWCKCRFVARFVHGLGFIIYVGFRLGFGETLGLRFRVQGLGF